MSLSIRIVLAPASPARATERPPTAGAGPTAQRPAHSTRGNELGIKKRSFRMCTHSVPRVRLVTMFSLWFLRSLLSVVLSSEVFSAGK